jgi:uncharacterized membrane protein YoaK (UPF0700 family)
MTAAADHARAGLPVGLAAVAGFVDAVGYLQLGGVFVSYMTGNTTKLAVGLDGDVSAKAGIAAAVIALFLGGVVAANLLRRSLTRGQQPAVIGLVTALLTAGSLLQDAGLPIWTIGVAAVAMGAENAVFESKGEVSIGLTYMTGTLVKAGDHIADALLGGPPFAWLGYAVRWFGLLCGAILGGLMFQKVGLDALWLAAAAAACLTVLAAI